MIDKCIFGVLFTGFVLALLVGPIYFFSDIGGFVVENPVETASFAVSFIINKNISMAEFMNRERSNVTLNLNEGNPALFENGESSLNLDLLTQATENSTHSGDDE